jgi:hypothetical protein
MGGVFPLSFTTVKFFILYNGLIPIASSRIPLHFHDGEPSDQRTGRGAHTTTTTGRKFLPGRVITLRWQSCLLLLRRRRRRRRERVTTESGFGVSPPLPLSVCV